MKEWPLVVIESPYAGDVERNVAFCRAVCRYAVGQGYSPYASHLIFTQFLDDNIPSERKAGIDAGLAWARHAEQAWFCLRPDEGLSNGMRYALNQHISEGRAVRFFRFTQEGHLIVEEQAA